MQNTHMAIMPLLLLVGIGLSLLFAVAIVVVSLIKAGKGAGVIVVMIALALCGLFLMGLLVPMYQMRRSAAIQHSQAMFEARNEEFFARQGDGAPDYVTQQLEAAPPREVPAEAWPHPPVQPMHETPPAPPAPEVSADSEFVGPENALSESSASPPEAAAPTPATRNAPAAATERPAWVDEVALPTRDMLLRKVINVGKYSSLDEIQAELPRQVDEALRDFMRESLPGNAASVIKLPPGYAVDHGVLADRWLETHPAAEHSFGEPMYTLHVLIQVDRATRDDLQARYEASIVEHRVGVIGLGGGLLLALLGTLYGYLKLDTATQGYYTGRLRLAAGLTGLSAAAAAAALVAERVVMWA